MQAAARLLKVDKQKNILNKSITDQFNGIPKSTLLSQNK